MILNIFLLPITEEVRVGASQRTISTCLTYYSKFQQELPSTFNETLTEWALTACGV